MDSPQSEEDNLTFAFDHLHPEIQRWIYEQQWTELREVQARTIIGVNSKSTDILLAAATAAGKTEAAFFPILSLIANNPKNSIQTIYVGPLRALINDQFLRLEQLCERLHVRVTKWHGDVQDSMKRQAREKPSGVLLITPESLEALFVRKSEILDRMFNGVDFIVIDEIHTFLSTERGLQLASILNRLDNVLGRLPRRIGLSATIGDLSVAKDWLRPSEPDSVHVICDDKHSAGIKLQIRGTLIPSRMSISGPSSNKKSEVALKDLALRSVADHLFKVLRTHGNNLVFASSRRDVELVSDLLRENSKAQDVPNEFFPHHGNLAREVREVLEHRLKAGDQPTTAVATSTLELGVDIGAVESVAQLGAPRSISALRQRIGRSGRREGKSQVLRLYVLEREIDEKSTLLDRLRTETFQSVASIKLMLDGWVEPPLSLKQNLSTLLHQILALILERGGISYSSLEKVLCVPGPFGKISKTTLQTLLRGMQAADQPLIEVAQDGTIMLGELGEKISDNYEFFAVFKSSEEFRIVANGRSLGTVSLINAFGPDDYVVFAGQRWKVLSVDDRARTVEVEAAPAGRAPMFEGGEPAPLHDRLIEEMRKTYVASDVPDFLNVEAGKFFLEGRHEFNKSALAKSSVTLADNSIYLFPWRGTSILDSLRLALKRSNIICEQSSISLRVNVDKQQELAAALKSLATETPPAGSELAEYDHNLDRSKYDSFIPRELLKEAAAADRLDAAALPEISLNLYTELISC